MIVTQTSWVVGVVHEMGKLPDVTIKPVKPVFRPNPERARTVFKDRPNIIATQTVGILWVVDKARKLPSVRVKHIESAVGPNPKLAEAYNNRAVAHQILGEFERSIEDYTEAINIIGKVDEALRSNCRLGLVYLSRSHVHIFSGSEEAAYQDIERAISLGVNLDEAEKRLEQEEPLLFDSSLCS